MSFVYKKRGVRRRRIDFPTRDTSLNNFSDAICLLYARKVSVGGIRRVRRRWTEHEISRRGSIDTDDEQL